jgi:hypothetical protein
MADTFAFLPCAVILILSLLRKGTYYAAFGPKQHHSLFFCRMLLFLSFSNYAFAPLFPASGPKLGPSLFFCRMRLFLSDFSEKNAVFGSFVPHAAEFCAIRSKHNQFASRTVQINAASAKCVSCFRLSSCFMSCLGAFSTPH